MNAPGSNKGFTLIELMIVIAIIAIIAAIAIPNLMESRIRANEAAAVTVIKGYATAQVTFQVGKQGREEANTASGINGFADNYRNLYYGVAVGQDGNLLELISKAHADAFAVADGNDGGTATNAASAVRSEPSAYQGYYFMSPAVETPATFFETNFAQLAIPANSVTTGTNLYWVGQQGTVRMKGLGDGKGGAGILHDATAASFGGEKNNPTGIAPAELPANDWYDM